MSNKVEIIRPACGLADADRVVARIDDLYAQIDCSPATPTSELNPKSRDGFLRVQLKEADRVLKELESVIPRSLGTIYRGIVNLVAAAPNGKVWDPEGYIKSKPTETVQILAQQWMSEHYDSDQCEWLLALATLRKCLRYPGSDIFPMGYHGYLHSAAIIDGTVKDIVWMNRYLKDRILFSTEGVRFVPEDLYEYY